MISQIKPLRQANHKLSIRHWKIHDIKLKLAEGRALLAKANYVSDENGYQRLFRKASKANRRLFRLLDSIGFFEFHITNGGYGAYKHQICLFLKNNRGGWFMYLKGIFAAKDDLNCHHINSNPSDNDSENLCYVTPCENFILAQITNTRYYGNPAVVATLEQLRLCPRFRTLEFETKLQTFLRLARESFSVFSPA